MFLSNSFKIFQLLACNDIFTGAKNHVYSYQLESQKPADLILHCFKTGYIKEFSMEKGLLIKEEKLKGKMVTFLMYKNLYF